MSNFENQLAQKMRQRFEQQEARRDAKHKARIRQIEESSNCEIRRIWLDTLVEWLEVGLEPDSSFKRDVKKAGLDYNDLYEQARHIIGTTKLTKDIEHVKEQLYEHPGADIEKYKAFLISAEGLEWSEDYCCKVFDGVMKIVQNDYEQALEKIALNKAKASEVGLSKMALTLGKSIDDCKEDLLSKKNKIDNKEKKVEAHSKKELTQEEQQDGDAMHETDWLDPEEDIVIDNVLYNLFSNGTACADSFEDEDEIPSTLIIPEKIKGTNGKSYIVDTFSIAELSDVIELSLPKTITSLDGAFTETGTFHSRKCKINLNGNPNIVFEDQIFYNGDKTIILNAQIAAPQGNYVIPEGVVEVCNNAFNMAELMETITFPSTIRMIGAAFDDCDSLEKVYIKANKELVKFYEEEDVEIFPSNPEIIYMSPSVTKKINIQEEAKIERDLRRKENDELRKKIKEELIQKEQIAKKKRKNRIILGILIVLQVILFNLFALLTIPITLFIYKKKVRRKI